MVSGNIERQSYQNLHDLGLDGFLNKPFLVDQLINAIRITVHNKRNNISAKLITRHNATKSIKDYNSANGRYRKKYTGCKVLAVEDIKMNMILIKKVLSKFDVDIDTATNGSIAFEKFKNNKYDMIFMDCQMPEMDGFDATKAIRQHELDINAKEGIPIVALTADAMIGDKEKCLAIGMNDYINKPFKENDIASMLEKYCSDKSP
jgi:CheY-like chemotaxis protein